MKPTAILAADLHIREDQPTCRTDDFEKTLWKKIEALCKLQEKCDCPIIIAGDIFHQWRTSPYLISKCISRLPHMYCIAGNHDLPHHNLKMIEYSALWTLQKAEKIDILGKVTGLTAIPLEVEFISSNLAKTKTIEVGAFHYGLEPKPVISKKGQLKIAVIHRLITESKDMVWRHTNAGTAKGLIKKLKGYDLILTGDNHKSFTAKIGNTLLVNPGSFTRQTAAQMEHEPCVYLWYAEENRAEKVILPHNKNTISRKHLEKEEERNERMDSFIEHLNDNYEIGLSYKYNLEEYFEINRESKTVKQLTWESVEA